MDDQRTDRTGGWALRKARFRISLRLLVSSVGLFTVLFAWVGVQRERRQIQFKAELEDKQYIRRYLEIAPVVPGMEANHKERIENLDAEIAEKRERLGLQPAEEFQIPPLGLPVPDSPMNPEYRQKLLAVLAQLDQLVTDADAVLADPGDAGIYARMEDIQEQLVETRAKVEEKLERLAL